MQRHIVYRSNGQPANAVRRTGYVTQALINQHGSYAKALAWLNAQENQAA